ncbi:MAG: hypothetical protein EZS28_011861 [Streblomastix strix]|uniref:Uncharacterized protein n=1 Tax=Streblomastix strix TaxID=222440 RepID=A0A5J4WCE9_9EUKA|nr:MAG: hypothetical protein EZS28_011861 [Streblomastix strix]
MVQVGPLFLQKNSPSQTQQDFINRLMVQVGVLLGERFILTSSFEEIERNLALHYYDSMTFVKEFGHPDLLITLTSNPR